MEVMTCKTKNCTRGIHAILLPCKLFPVALFSVDIAGV